MTVSKSGSGGSTVSSERDRIPYRVKLKRTADRKCASEPRLKLEELSIHDREPGFFRILAAIDVVFDGRGIVRDAEVSEKSSQNHARSEHCESVHHDPPNQM